MSPGFKEPKLGSKFEWSPGSPSWLTRYAQNNPQILRPKHSYKATCRFGCYCFSLATSFVSSLAINLQLGSWMVLELHFACSRPASMLDAIGYCFLYFKQSLTASGSVGGVSIAVFSARNPFVSRWIIRDCTDCSLAPSFSCHIPSIFF